MHHAVSIFLFLGWLTLDLSPCSSHSLPLFLVQLNQVQPAVS